MEILILDDNEATRRMLRKIIEEDYAKANIHMASSYQEAVWIADNNILDLALLDIEIGDGHTGIDVGKMVIEKSPNVELMIISSHPEWALDTFEIHPYDFHVKPIDIMAFKRSVNQVLKQIEDSKNTERFQENTADGRLLVKTKKEIYWIPYSRILFIEKLQKDVYIHTADDAVAIRQNISDIEKKLSSSFLRVHKSYIVNIDHISKILEHGDRSYEIYFLNSDKTAFMSRYKASVLFDRLD